jgi:phosphoserine phosphatase RsbU/P
LDQRKLHKLVETIASGKFESETDMLITAINKIVDNENIDINGGRIWQLEESKRAYGILYQTGNVERIEADFKLKIDDYPIFDLITKERTILGHETNEVLREAGIFQYSASGVGSRRKLDSKYFYEYLLALNSNKIDEDFRITLNIIATALTSQIKQKRSSAKEKHLREDLDKARQLQKSILPEHEYNFHDYQLYGITDPAEIVGGDFFDYLEFGEDSERLGVAIGDAASKGVSAAAEAMYISGALRMANGFEIKISALMRKMNQLVSKIFEDDKFASLFYGELTNHRSGLFMYANAGHNPPMLIRSSTGEIELLNPTGPLLGPAPNAKYYIDSVNIHPGDALVLFSDGVTESADKNFDHYGEEKLSEVIKKCRNLSAKEIVYNILDDVIKFAKDGQYTDDKTLVVIKRKNKTTE